MATQPINKNPERFTIKQAAENVGCHQNTIRNLIASGQLPASRIGLRIIRIDKNDLDALFTPVVGGEFSVWNR
jgi:excisionase family DNA binding protein